MGSYNITGSGGSYGSGVLFASANYSVTGLGGLWGSGISIASGSYNITDSGGAWSSGVSLALGKYNITGSGGAWGSGGLTNAYYYINGSGGAYASGVGPNTANFNAAPASAGGWASGIAKVNGVFSIVTTGAALCAAGNPSDDQPSDIVPTLFGESPVGLPCQFGLVVRRVTMVMINHAYVPAVTVCNSQVAIRRIVQRMR